MNGSTRDPRRSGVGRSAAGFACVAAIIAVLVSGCGNPSAGPSTSQSAASSSNAGPSASQLAGTSSGIVPGAGVSDAWISLPKSGATTTTAGGIVNYTGSAPITLVSASSSVASSAVLKDARKPNSATPVSVEIHPGWRMPFTPKTIYIELQGLKSKLKPGQVVDIDFVADNGQTIPMHPRVKAES